MSSVDDDDSDETLPGLVFEAVIVALSRLLLLLLALPTPELFEVVVAVADARLLPVPEAVVAVVAGEGFVAAGATGAGVAPVLFETPMLLLLLVVCSADKFW